MSHEAKKDEVTRREFIDTVATVSVIGAGAMTFLGVIQLPMPKVLNEPPAQFKVGFPAEYTVNSFKMVVERNVFIFRHEDGFRALSAVCTHLGCIVNKTDWGFACPCHGSQFDQDGNVIRGPAPRPLDWFRMTVAPDGQLLVDMKRTVRREDVLVV